MADTLLRSLARGVSLARKALYCTRYYRHRGDTTSPWWCPAVGDQVADCAGRRARVVSVDIWGDVARLDYTPFEPLRVRTMSWINCVSPVEWNDRGTGHRPGAHDGPAAFVGREGQ